MHGEVKASSARSSAWLLGITSTNRVSSVGGDTPSDLFVVVVDAHGPGLREHLSSEAKVSAAGVEMSLAVVAIPVDVEDGFRAHAGTAW
jgi:hypothetical protein